MNFVYKTKLTWNRPSTPFFIHSKYSSGAESGPTTETSSHLTVSSSKESSTNRRLGRYPGLMRGTQGHPEILSDLTPNSTACRSFQRASSGTTVGKRCALALSCSAVPSS
jgi:hypothetical protein